MENGIIRLNQENKWGKEREVIFSQGLSGHRDRKSLSIYQDLSLSDVEKEYWLAMKDFPVQ